MKILYYIQITMKSYVLLMAAACFLVATTAKADTDAFTLYQKLRCLICQGQSIAESDAPFARDIRSFIDHSLKNGSSEKQILDRLVERYGSYILMKPPLQTNTLLLWAMPFLFLSAGSSSFINAVLDSDYSLGKRSSSKIFSTVPRSISCGPKKTIPHPRANINARALTPIISATRGDNRLLLIIVFSPH